MPKKYFVSCQPVRFHVQNNSHIQSQLIQIQISDQLVSLHELVIQHSTISNFSVSEDVILHECSPRFDPKSLTDTLTEYELHRVCQQDCCLASLNYKMSPAHTRTKMMCHYTSHLTALAGLVTVPGHITYLSGKIDAIFLKKVFRRYTRCSENQCWVHLRSTVPLRPVTHELNSEHNSN